MAESSSYAREETEADREYQIVWGNLMEGAQANQNCAPGSPGDAMIAIELFWKYLSNYRPVMPSFPWKYH